VFEFEPDLFPQVADPDCIEVVVVEGGSVESAELVLQLVERLCVLAGMSGFWRDIAIKVGPNKDAIVSSRFVVLRSARIADCKCGKLNKAEHSGVLGWGKQCWRSIHFVKSLM
jgi:hypothetical protein